ncbi:unnamed protein product [Cladocopium goreaui]|uniref:Uncharacterized protein n=1 Tax=Cladocopium goreaui TaxID=2562237 RepID=A0A9P1DKM9_9DINO|nr:unnamed protein product [Cladocopium goreaui]
MPQRDDVREHKVRLSLPSLTVIERSGSENCAPPVNCQTDRSQGGIQKALGEVHVALKASEQLLRPRISPRPLTSRESRGDSGASPRFHKDLAEVPAVPSWLRQPQWKTRSSGLTRRRMSTGSIAPGNSGKELPDAVSGRPTALAQARSLHKEMVQAEERSRQFSLSIYKRLGQAVMSPDPGREAPSVSSSIKQYQSPQHSQHSQHSHHWFRWL